MEWLRKHGLPEHANASKIHDDPDRGLTLENLNEFGHPIREAKQLDPQLFSDETGLSLDGLFELDLSKPLFSLPENINLDNLFEFNQKKTDKKKQK